MKEKGKEKVTGKMMDVAGKSKKLGIYSKNFKVKDKKEKLCKDRKARLFP